jgi:subtilase family serine protease
VHRPELKDLTQLKETIMHFNPRSVLFLGALASALALQGTRAQAPASAAMRPLIVQQVDESARETLERNTRPEATAHNDRGAVADDFPMEHMLLQLKRSAEQEKALGQLIDELHTRGSPNFHHWLTAGEFGQRFGLAKQDINAVGHWLESHGFRVNLVYPSGTLIDFSGTAGQVRDAFQTEIHHLDVEGEQHFANMSDPRVPAALAPAVLGVVSLHDFRPHGMVKPRADFTFTAAGATFQAIVPGDLATIYKLNPLFSAGVSGQGQTVVVIEPTDVFSTSDWDTFRSTFGLSSFSSGSFSQIHPAPPSGSNNCSDPGVTTDDVEAILDAEYASAAAPSAAIVLASCSNTSTTFGGLIALQNLLNESSTPPAVVSISFGECEAGNGATANAAYNSTYQQAVAEGVSVYVAAGDSGAAGCDLNQTSATHGIGVSGFASTPYNVAVGGTDFGDSFAGTNSMYWNSTNSSTFESALSYVPEIPWNNSCASVLISTVEGFATTFGSNGFCNSAIGSSFLTTASASGGPSACATGAATTSGVVSGSCQGWAKPSWQSIVGNPADGVRDVPDVSMFAANGVWGHYYVFCFTDPFNGGVPCTGSPAGWAGAGGTSFGAPIWAGIQALINQKTGARQGNPNPILYQLAATEYGSSGNGSCNSTLGNGAASSCVFYDVTLGDMDVNCSSSFNCFDPSGSNGVLSTSNTSYAPAYGTTVGWDFATGIGTVNVANLVNSWPVSGPAPNFSLSASPSGLTIAQGANGTGTVTVTPSNGFTGSVTLSASGLPSGVTAAFSTNPTTGTSTLTLNASSSAALGTATVTVTGTSGSLTHTTSVSLTVSAAPNFGLSASPGSVTITQGSAGTSTITVSPSNGFTGSVTLAASGLPSGVTAAFSQNPITGTNTLTLTASATAATGTLTVTVTGTSGSLTHTTSVTLTVNAAAVGGDFTLSASPNSVSVSRGSSVRTAITIAPSSGFTGSVSLSASRLPSGVTASFSPDPAMSTSTLTLTASSSAPRGTVTVTVTGTSGSLRHTTTVSLSVHR